MNYPNYIQLNKMIGILVNVFVLLIYKAANAKLTLYAKKEKKECFIRVTSSFNIYVNVTQTNMEKL